MRLVDPHPENMEGWNEYIKTLNAALTRTYVTTKAIPADECFDIAEDLYFALNDEPSWLAQGGSLAGMLRQLNEYFTGSPERVEGIDVLVRLLTLGRATIKGLDMTYTGPLWRGPLEEPPHE